MAIVYGGRSGEHEVSVESARSVIAAIDRTKHDVVPVAITHEGAWLAAEPDALLAGGQQTRPRILPTAEPSSRELVRTERNNGDLASLGGQVDVVFPLVHGTYGEDGCLQGLFELASLPYVGSGVLASAVGMDKITMKAVFKAHGLPVVDHVEVLRAHWERSPHEVCDEVAENLGFPCFVKPAALGSSVGISKVHSARELPAALSLAAEFGSRILVERAANARELECGVLGNDEPAASVVGEVIPHREYYDYEAKYADAETEFDIPAHLDAATMLRVQSLAVQSFKAVGAAGMARVDFFLDRGTDELYLNEINTIPGFTKMSVYPRLWAASGVPYSQLIDRLIELAVERHADESRNRTRYTD
ncbi:MAG: D-alanine-D-alanine ligase [Chloroflexota bacterium]|nr:D-alanine-D-alanine ligase [Chloroflexota bacterium]